MCPPNLVRTAPMRQGPIGAHLAPLGLHRPTILPGGHHRAAPDLSAIACNRLSAALCTAKRERPRPRARFGDEATSSCFLWAFDPRTVRHSDKAPSRSGAALISQPRLCQTQTGFKLAPMGRCRHRTVPPSPDPDGLICAPMGVSGAHDGVVQRSLGMCQRFWRQGAAVFAGWGGDAGAHAATGPARARYARGGVWTPGAVSGVLPAWPIPGGAR